MRTDIHESFNVCSAFYDGIQIFAMYVVVISVFKQMFRKYNVF